MNRRCFLLALAAAAPTLTAAAQAPMSSSPVVEIKGPIARVQLAAGQGMPFLEVKTAAGVTKVWLGSMRYLMEQNFNPKADQEAVVKGYKVSDGILAIRVTVNGKALTLRDEQGYPVWRGGRHGGKDGKR